MKIVKMVKCKFCGWTTSLEMRESLIEHVMIRHPDKYGMIWRQFGEVKDHAFDGRKKLNVGAS